MNETEMIETPGDDLASNMNQEVNSGNNLQMGSMVDMDINCAGCNKVVSTSNAYCFVDKEGNDIYYCEECKKNIDRALERETKNPYLPGAVLFGLLAGVVSGAIWCAISYFTHHIIGYVAIAVGYLIGWGVVIGSGKKRGVTLQLISAVITIIAILSASYMTEIFSLNHYLRTELGISEFIWISPFNSDLLKDIISPIGLFIWAIGIAAAYKVPAAKKI